MKIYVSSPIITNISKLSNTTVAFTSSLVGSVVLYFILAFGASLYIHVTFATAVPVFPASSTNSNVNSPFSVNVYVLLPSLFVILTFSLSKLIVAVTSWFVGSTSLYPIVATGAVLSIQFTVATAVPTFPNSSS